MTTPTPRRPVGRPPQSDVPRKPRPILLSDAEAETARKLGNGSISAGVRAALAIAAG
jgi:hypothetical protein